ncbi:MAG: substrate-binding domain-containing protein [Xanthobacteraceae bacterium]|nr:substrate-binding domain-containing protein [Xanthobacteraceae bacterium]
MTALAGPAVAQDYGLKVLAAGSALHGLRPAAAQFTRESGIAVAVANDHGHNIRKHALAGEAQADVVLVPTEWAEEIVAAGRADKSTMLAIGAVRMGAVVKTGATRPDVASMDGLRCTFVSAEAVLLTLAPTGDHLMKVIDRFGLTATVAPKLKRFDTATLLNKHLAENGTSGAIGFGPATEILTWRGRGVEWGGPVPDEIQIVLPYSAVILSGAQADDGAKKLLACLATASARKHFTDSGVE